MIARVCDRAGFAIVAALVIVTLSLATLAAVAAMLVSARDMAASDAQADQLREALRTGLAEACERLRWAWPVSDPNGLPAGGSGPRAYTITITPSGSPAVAGDESFAVVVTAGSGRLQKMLTAAVAVRPGGLPLGVSVGSDLYLQAPLVVEGSGVYAGGSIYGRELLQFAPPPGWTGVGSPDTVAAALWPEAAAHTEAVAELDSALGQALMPADEAIAALSAHCSPPGAALNDGCLDLSILPARVPMRDPAAPANGLLVVVDAAGLPDGLAIRGTRSPLACPLTLVVVGDAAISASAPAAAEVFGLEYPRLAGALIVTGMLSVNDAFEVIGHLGAGALTVRTTLKVTVPPEWRQVLPPGYRDVTVVTSSQ